MFIFKKDQIHVVAHIYVDDVLLIGNDNEKLLDVKDYLHTQFSIKDLETLKYFLGIKVARSPEGFVISQRKYTIGILEYYGVQGGQPNMFPVE